MNKNERDEFTEKLVELLRNSSEVRSVVFDNQRQLFFPPDDNYSSLLLECREPSARRLSFRCPRVRRSGAPKRLCWLSRVNGNNIPRFFLSYDGVDDCQQFAHAGNNGDFLGLAGVQ